MLYTPEDAARRILWVEEGLWRVGDKLELNSRRALAEFLGEGWREKDFRAGVAYAVEKGFLTPLTDGRYVFTEAGSAFVWGYPYSSADLFLASDQGEGCLKTTPRRAGRFLWFVDCRLMPTEIANRQREAREIAKRMGIRTTNDP